jgi:thiamine transport system ATP-binding protein
VTGGGDASEPAATVATPPRTSALTRPPGSGTEAGRLVTDGGRPEREDATARPGVTLDGVTVSFDGVRALTDVSLSVVDGEFFTLVGPSGCGKTTTLRVIAGFETPDAGTVAIGGRDVAGVPPEARGIGVVFQSYALFPTMTVRENVGYGLRFTDPPGGVTAAERIDRLLELVDIAGLGGRDPAALSGGQRQRVALARALAPGPDVLLLDEPLSALDARLRERLRVTVREIQRELGITTVYVTHDQAEALAISDRVAVLQNGRIEQVGTPESVYRAPASRFVASFVGDNNLFDAEVIPPAADATSGTNGETVTERQPRARLAAVDGTPLDPPPATGGESITGTGTPPDSGPVVRLPTADVDPGDRVTLCVRPEVIALSAAGQRRPQPSTVGESGGRDAPPRQVRLDATVRSVEFLGDAYRVRCGWRGRTLRVKTTADSPPDGAVRLEFDVADAHLLPDGVES